MSVLLSLPAGERGVFAAVCEAFPCQRVPRRGMLRALLLVICRFLTLRTATVEQVREGERLLPWTASQGNKNAAGLPRDAASTAAGPGFHRIC